jgi:hypothetical protein
MPKLVENMFSVWEFTDDEQLIAQTFPEWNRRYIHNVRAGYANDKITLAWNPVAGEDADNTFIRNHEYLRGAIEALSLILNLSEDSEMNLQEYVETLAKEKSRTDEDDATI